AAQVFRELAASLPYPVALQLVTDEEVGGRDGTRYQLDHGVRGRFVIVGETSGLHIVNESKGMLVVRLLAAGLVAHAAYQWLGDNALVKLQRTVASLLARYPVATEEVWRTTVNLARVGTRNEARNQVPADAEALLDIRFPPGDADLSGKTVADVTAFLQGFCEPGVTPVVDVLDQPHHADQDRPEVLRLPPVARAIRVTCSASTASATGASTVSWASPPWPSAWAARASTAPTNTPTSARSCRTTAPCVSSSARLRSSRSG